VSECVCVRAMECRCVRWRASLSFALPRYPALTTTTPSHPPWPHVGAVDKRKELMTPLCVGERKEFKNLLRAFANFAAYVERELVPKVRPWLLCVVCVWPSAPLGPPARPSPPRITTTCWLMVVPVSAPTLLGGCTSCECLGAGCCPGPRGSRDHPHGPPPLSVSRRLAGGV
jgi:hypothetical protein